MDVYWLEQSAADMPSNETWLSVGEVNHLHTLRFPKRRADWLLGRWTAKNAVAAYLKLSREPAALADIEIRPRPCGAPQAFFKAEPASVSISLSHRAGLGACVVAPQQVLLGCDLEIVEPHSDAFLADYFTPEEHEIVAQVGVADRVWLVSLLWSAKESALKALGEGLRLDARSLTAKLCGSGNDNGCSENACSPTTNLFHHNCWNRVEVRRMNAHILNGWWNLAGAVLRTVIADPAPAPPTLIPSVSVAREGYLCHKYDL
jgi:4'-phosphopantetheinyl transferase